MFSINSQGSGAWQKSITQQKYISNYSQLNGGNIQQTDRFISDQPTNTAQLKQKSASISVSLNNLNGINFSKEDQLNEEKQLISKSKSNIFELGLEKYNSVKLLSKNGHFDLKNDSQKYANLSNNDSAYFFRDKSIQKIPDPNSKDTISGIHSINFQNISNSSLQNQAQQYSFKENNNLLDSKLFDREKVNNETLLNSSSSQTVSKNPPITPVYNILNRILGEKGQQQKNFQNFTDFNQTSDKQKKQQSFIHQPQRDSKDQNLSSIADSRFNSAILNNSTNPNKNIYQNNIYSNYYSNDRLNLNIVEKSNLNGQKNIEDYQKYQSHLAPKSMDESQLIRQIKSLNSNISISPAISNSYKNLDYENNQFQRPQVSILNNSSLKYNSNIENFLKPGNDSAQSQDKQPEVDEYLRKKMSIQSIFKPSQSDREIDLLSNNHSQHISSLKGPLHQRNVSTPKTISSENRISSHMGYYKIQETLLGQDSADLLRPMENITETNEQQSQQSSSLQSGNASKNIMVKPSTPNTKIQQKFVFSPLMDIMRQVDNFQINFFEKAKYSIKKNGFVQSYSANTHQGMVRGYNEDRVSIILNIMKPPNRVEENWPQCSFFAVYDGHGGAGCADFLRDSLHQFIIRDSNFPWNPRQALRSGIDKAESQFFKIAFNDKDELIDKSGSCVIVVLVVDDMCYIANVGDSRAVLSRSGGQYTQDLSRDHQPNDEVEYKRIIDAGGRIYQSKMTEILNENDLQCTETQLILGPHRVHPGRLSVSRTIGDFEAKLNRYGGNPKVIIPTPDIKTVKLTDEFDFILLACDGVYDKCTSEQIIECVWQTAALQKQGIENVHQFCGESIDNILKFCMARKSTDNVTIVMIGFKSLKLHVFPQSQEKSKSTQSITAFPAQNGNSNQQISNLAMANNNENNQYPLTSIYRSLNNININGNNSHILSSSNLVKQSVKNIQQFQTSNEKQSNQDSKEENSTISSNTPNMSNKLKNQRQQLRFQKFLVDDNKN